MISDTAFWKKIDELKWRRKRALVKKRALDWDKERAKLLKMKPQKYWDEFSVKLKEKADSVGKSVGWSEGSSGNDSAWDFTFDIVGHGKSMYDRVVSDPVYAEKVLSSGKYGLENFGYLIPDSEEVGDLVSKADLNAALAELDPPLRALSKRKASGKKASAKPISESSMTELVHMFEKIKAKRAAAKKPKA